MPITTEDIVLDHHYSSEDKQIMQHPPVYDESEIAVMMVQDTGSHI
jgi:hypothetical protein